MPRNDGCNVNNTLGSNGNSFVSSSTEFICEKHDIIRNIGSDVRQKYSFWKLLEYEITRKKICKMANLEENLLKHSALAVLVLWKATIA